jgi:hypothetical protein
MTLLLHNSVMYRGEIQSMYRAWAGWNETVLCLVAVSSGRYSTDYSMLKRTVRVLLHIAAAALRTYVYVLAAA